MGVLHLVRVVAFVCLAACAIAPADGKLLASISGIQPAFLNLVVVDPTSANISSVVYDNRDLGQFNTHSPAWNSANRTVYLSVTRFTQKGISTRIIGLQLAADLSKATLVADWDVSPLTKIFTMHYEPTRNSLLLVCLNGTQQLYASIVDISTGKATGRKLFSRYLADTDGPTGLASVLDLQSRRLVMPLYDLDSEMHTFSTTSIDTFSSTIYGKRCANTQLPYAMFLDPATNKIKAVFRDREIARLSFGTSTSDGQYEESNIKWIVKEFTNVVGGLAPLDKNNQEFFTLLADSTGQNFALVTADTNTGAIKKFVKWPKQQPPPSSLLFV